MPHILHIVSYLLVLKYVCSDGPVVETKLGNVTGIQNAFVFNGVMYNVSKYLGLPYAKSPVGNLRFRKPIPYGNFTNNSFHATSYGHSCIQYNPMGDEPDQSEDCLFLNVYVPEQTPESSTGHAVMIFLHGGGLVSGSARKYPADTLASVGNVIVVTINYRLWIFGFLDMNKPGTPGNVGHWDQHMAFKWVSDNIHSFGGDPTRVTIFGQSAGSSSVSLQSIYPGNHGLFRGAICESGNFPIFENILRDKNTDTAMLMAEKLKCNTESAENILECFQETSADAFVGILANTLKHSPADGNKLFFFFTTIDGEFLRRNPLELLKDTNALADEVKFLRSLDLINGFTSDEGALWVMRFPGAFEDTFNISRELMNSVYIPSIYPTTFGEDVDVPEVVKDSIAHEYTDWRTPDDPFSLVRQFSKLYGNINMDIPAIVYSRLHALTVNSRSYLFHFEAAMNGHAIASPGWLHVSGHGDELAPLFGFQFPKLAKNGTTIPPDSWELELSDRLIGYWTNFTKYGNPNGMDGNTWPIYDLENQKYMKLDRTDSIGQYLRARETNFWRKIVPAVFSSEEKDCLTSGPVSSANGQVVQLFAIICAYACAMFCSFINFL